MGHAESFRDLVVYKKARKLITVFAFRVVHTLIKKVIT